VPLFVFTTVHVMFLASTISHDVTSEMKNDINCHTLLINELHGEQSCFRS
jgi:hypothetical protein